MKEKFKAKEAGDSVHIYLFDETIGIRVTSADLDAILDVEVSAKRAREIAQALLDLADKADVKTVLKG